MLQWDVLWWVFKQGSKVAKKSLTVHDEWWGEGRGRRDTYVPNGSREEQGKCDKVVGGVVVEGD